MGGVVVVERVTFINSRGRSIVLSNQRPFILESVEGKGDVEADVQMQSAPYQHGSGYIDTRLNPRYLTLRVAILGDNPAEVAKLRQELTSVFNPTLGEGLIIYENDFVKREITGALESIPKFPTGRGNKLLRMQRALIHIVCPDPDWISTTTHNYKLEDFVGNFRFPFHFPVRFATRGDGKTLVNNGDVPTPVKIEFRGPAYKPMITNMRTGEFIRVNTNIPVGHKLILNTEFGNKRVEIIKPNGDVENAFHYIDTSSTFFELDVGESRISFLAESGTPEVYVEYKERYLSV